MNINQIYNEDCQEGIKRIPDASIDCILTDPPYLYLKNQKLDRPFDERTLFSEFKRVLKPSGFVVLFGRGTSFYRWNTILAELGFMFKEEIIWDKSYSSSPVTPLSRIHETISIHAKEKGILNKAKVPYLEMKSHDIDSVCQDIKRMKSILNNTKSLDNVLAYLEDNKKFINAKRIDKYAISIQPGTMQMDRAAAVLSSIENGMNEKSIIRSDYSETIRPNNTTVRRNLPNGDRSVSVVQAITFGMIEKSIIREIGNRYKAIHPTQKPVRLLERLLTLTTQPDDVVLDIFAGSCSTAIACVNTNRKFIGFEIDKEYYEAGVKRLNEALSEPKLAM